MTIAICDDEPEMLTMILSAVSSALGERNISAECHTFDTPEGLLDFIKTNAADAVFLDIDMPHISGMEIAGSISLRFPETAIIFVTCHDALVYDTFQYRPLAFIRKSHFGAEIDGVVQRLAEHFSSQRAELTFCRGTQIVRIKLCDIIYIEADGNYLNITTTYGKERQRNTLTSIQAQLTSDDFVRVHKGFIVNLKFILRKDGDLLYMSNSDTIPIGRTYDKSVRDRLLQSFRK